MSLKLLTHKTMLDIGSIFAIIIGVIVIGSFVFQIFEDKDAKDLKRQQKSSSSI